MNNKKITGEWIWQMWKQLYEIQELGWAEITELIDEMRRHPREVKRFMHRIFDDMDPAYEVPENIKAIADYLEERLTDYAIEEELCVKCGHNLAPGNWDRGTWLDPPEPRCMLCVECGWVAEGDPPKPTRQEIAEWKIDRYH